MKEKTEQELKANYNRFIEILKKYFTEERLEKLLFMYSPDELGLNLTVSPASGNKSYHNAYDGGYIDHIFNVCKNALKVKELFIQLGGKPDFTDEELLFTALHHDLGKLGIKGELHYVANDSDWHIKNRGEYYKRNENITFMSITDRTFFTLNHYGIQYNEKEYFGMKLTDGLYDEDNTKYLKVYDASKAVKSNLPHLIHWADHMSTVIESQDNNY
jgi:hypothetical protein